MNQKCSVDLAHNLVLPTLLFAALGGMTWAVRGSSGYGASAGCLFAGVTWGTAWWFIARDPSGATLRRYSSGWIVLAVAAGVGFSGNRGWMQWTHFFDGKLSTNYAQGQFEPISPNYGLLWLFLAGVPWAGLGACLLAWCGSLRETRLCHWAARIGCGVGGAFLLQYLYRAYPQYFLPLYDSLEAKYLDLDTNPSLKRLINDCGQAMFHLGLYFGFLLYEVVRREWKNVLLITTAGLINGIGWAACQNWTWASKVWPGAPFNFWRCWESSGGISIGIAYGIAYFLVNRPMSDAERAKFESRTAISGPNFEWLIVFSGLTVFLAQIFLFYTGAGSQLYFFASWSIGCYAAILAFAAAYYVFYRQSTAEDPSRMILPVSRGMNDYVAILFAAALIVGVFLDVKKLGVGARLYSLAVVLLGMAWYFSQRSSLRLERERNTPPGGDPNLERLGLALGLLLGLGTSVVNGLKGWCNIYLDPEKSSFPVLGWTFGPGDEKYWIGVLWWTFGPIYLLGLIVFLVGILYRPLPRNFRGDRIPHAYGVMWLVLIVQNVLAQLVTGKHSNWNETVFSAYYLLLFFISGVIVFHYQSLRRRSLGECSVMAERG
ncbi:MAG: hypothetical protein U0872_04135 [Planctomycetaceae bacterium]